MNAAIFGVVVAAAVLVLAVAYLIIQAVVMFALDNAEGILMVTAVVGVVLATWRFWR